MTTTTLSEMLNLFYSFKLYSTQKLEIILHYNKTKCRVGFRNHTRIFTKTGMQLMKYLNTWFTLTVVLCAGNNKEIKKIMSGRAVALRGIRISRTY